MHPTDDGFLPLLLRAAESEPDRHFARMGAELITVGELARSSAVLAAWLAGRGVRPGDHVALMLRNSPATIALLYAIARLGAVWVPLNVQARGDNLGYILDHAAPRLVIAEPELRSVIGDSGARLAAERIATAGDIATALRGPAPAVAPSVPHDADAPFAIMYTSGTTGRPKGVIVSHRMLRLSGESVLFVSKAADGAVMHMWEPMYHIGGAQMIVLPLLRRALLVMFERFSATRFWAEVKDCGATHIHFLGGILQILLKQPPGPFDNSHGARIAWGGGAPRDIWRPFTERFGCEVRECYGMTECSSITTANLDGTPGSVGKPLPWLQVTIMGPGGQPVATGEQGEIVVETSLPGAMTRGYLNNPEATAKAIRGKQFWTGDIGSFDAGGNMYFHGRMTDSVRVKGENVAAFEVEHVAAQHPAIEDCVIVGVPGELGEHDIKLYVKLREGMTVEPRALSTWLGTRLAPYQNPRYIAVVPDFERTPSQRIMKHKLAKDVAGAWDRDA